MLYTIIITTAEGEQHTHTTDATDARQAHDNAAALYDGMEFEKIRVYPTTVIDGVISDTGVARGALLVARRTAANGVRRTGGNATQIRIDKELTAANARLHGCKTAARIVEVMSDYSHDTQEYFATAAAAIVCGVDTKNRRGEWTHHDGITDGADIETQYHTAYTALNAHISAQRTATQRELSTEYIKDGGGDLVAVNSAVAMILRGSDKWTPAESAEMDAETAARLDSALHKAAAILKPTQREIIRMSAANYSVSQIAKGLNPARHVRTVQTNLAIIRDKCAAYIHEHAPEFDHLIKAAEVTAAAKAANDSGRRTQDGKARHDKDAAERMRRYRARKAAAKAAAAKGE